MIIKTYFTFCTKYYNKSYFITINWFDNNNNNNVYLIISKHNNIHNKHNPSQRTQQCLQS